MLFAILSTLAIHSSVSDPNTGHVLVDQTGAIKLVLPENFVGELQGEIPVFSYSDEGELVRGVFYHGVGVNGSGQHTGVLPHYIQRDETGRWEIVEAMWVMYHGPIGEWKTVLPRTGSVPVYDPAETARERERLREQVSRGAPNIRFTHDTTLLPSDLDATEVERVLQTVVDLYNDLLANDFAPVNVVFEWADLPASMIATARVGFLMPFPTVNVVGIISKSSTVRTIVTAALRRR